jgi:hypothetical protein
MFEPSVLAAAGVDHGLLFLDTDHGFNLAFDPGAVARAAPVVEVARFHGDDADRLLWAARGQPPAYRYRYLFQPDNAPAIVSVEPLVFAATAPDPLRIEGESLWPPRAQQGGWAFAEFAYGTCASAGRWLALHAVSGEEAASARVGVPTLTAGGTVAPRVALGPGARGELTMEADGALIQRWNLGDPGLVVGPARCVDLPAAAFPAGVRSLSLVLAAEPWSSRAAAAPLIALDRVDVTGAKTIDH